MSQNLPQGINFDESIKEWRRNKYQVAPGQFVYVCGCPTKTGGFCQRKIDYEETSTCKQHAKIMLREDEKEGKERNGRNERSVKRRVTVSNFTKKVSKVNSPKFK
jgi:hypothetical protein